MMQSSKESPPVPGKRNHTAQGGKFSIPLHEREREREEKNGEYPFS